MADRCDEYMNITCKITGDSCDSFCDCGDCWVAEENCDMACICEDEFMDVYCDIINGECDKNNDCECCKFALEYEEQEERENWIFSLKCINPTRLVESKISYFVNDANTIAKYASVEDAVSFLRGNRWESKCFKKYTLAEEIPNLNKRYPEWWKYRNWYHVNDIEYYLYDDPKNILLVVVGDGVYGIAPRIEADEY